MRSMGTYWAVYSFFVNAGTRGAVLSVAGALCVMMSAFCWNSLLSIGLLRDELPVHGLAIPMRHPAEFARMVILWLAVLQYLVMTTLVSHTEAATEQGGTQAWIMSLPISDFGVVGLRLCAVFVGAGAAPTLAVAIPLFLGWGFELYYAGSCLLSVATLLMFQLAYATFASCISRLGEGIAYSVAPPIVVLMVAMAQQVRGPDDQLLKNLDYPAFLQAGFDGQLAYRGLFVTVSIIAVGYAVLVALQALRRVT